jgi:hypothetical protein
MWSEKGIDVQSDERVFDQGQMDHHHSVQSSPIPIPHSHPSFSFYLRQHHLDKEWDMTYFPAKPSFDQKSSFIIFSGTLNLFLLMMRSSYSIIGLIGSSGTTTMLPLLAVPSEETSTTSSFSRTVRLRFYSISLCPPCFSEPTITCSA